MKALNLSRLETSAQTQAMVIALAEQAANSEQFGDRFAARGIKGNFSFGDRFAARGGKGNFSFGDRFAARGSKGDFSFGERFVARGKKNTSVSVGE